MTIRRRIFPAAIGLLCLLVTSSFAQEKAKPKSYTFHGKVVAVTANGLTVDGEKVEGWMGAMTMSYPVDKPEVLKKIKVGDQIMATVFDGDTTLHSVEVMPQGKSDKSKSTK
jgi:Cu/Ag efflux protein CusF